MESGSVCTQRQLMGELLQSHELSRQLLHRLEESCSIELPISLVQSIIISIEKVISMAKSSNSQGDRHVTTTGGTESARSDNKSPKSGTSEHGLHDEECRNKSKKRKAMTKWTQVRACTVTGTEGPSDDGHSWRKYGQKNILGTKHPRGYYRCTHRNSQGCLATKHVQRTDENPTVFDITYRGEHTCILRTSRRQENAKSIPDYQMLVNHENSTGVMTESLDNNDFHSYFSFTSTPVSHIKCDNYNHIFSSPSTMDDQYISSGCISTFISPATSECNFISLPPYFENTPMNLQASKSDLMEMISTRTSPEGMDFSYPEDLDPIFPLGASFYP